MDSYSNLAKNDLIAHVVARGLAKNKTAAREMKADSLRALLVENDAANRAALRESIDPTPVAPTDEPLAPPAEVVVAPRERVRVFVPLTREQRARKLARNRRRHKRSLAPWPNAQRTPRESASLAN